MPIIISPAQGLLLLIDKTKRDVLMGGDTNEEELAALIKLYILGAHTPEDYQKIIDLLDENLSANYKISYTPNTINSDPSRRYFETHLALWSLSDGLQTIALNDLNEHCKRLYDIMPKEWTKHDILNGIQKIESASIESVSLQDKISNQELVENSNEYFEEGDWIKMQIIFNCWIIGILNVKNKELPFNIYSSGFFNTDNRGREDRARDQEIFLSQNIGLMTSNMPSPVNDITHKSTHESNSSPNIKTDRHKYPPGAEKASDIRTFIPGRIWPQHNFSQLVHPFSNAISGTMLIQLRCLYAIYQHKNLVKQDPILVKNKLANYFRLFSSLLLLHSGGHSWFEFLSPIFLPETKEYFSNQTNVVANPVPEMNLEYILFNENQHAINQAINAAINYNRTLLINEAARAQILTPVKLRSSTTAPTTQEPTSTFSSIRSLVTLIAEANQHQLPAETPQILASRTHNLGFFSAIKSPSNLIVNKFMQILKNTDEPTRLLQYLVKFFNDPSIDSVSKQQAHNSLINYKSNLNISSNTELEELNNYSVFYEKLNQNPQNEESEIDPLPNTNKKLTI